MILHHCKVDGVRNSRRKAFWAEKSLEQGRSAFNTLGHSESADHARCVTTSGGDSCAATRTAAPFPLQVSRMYSFKLTSTAQEWTVRTFFRTWFFYHKWRRLVPCSKIFDTHPKPFGFEGFGACRFGSKSKKARLVCPGLNHQLFPNFRTWFFPKRRVSRIDKVLYQNLVHSRT